MNVAFTLSSCESVVSLFCSGPSPTMPKVIPSGTACTRISAFFSGISLPTNKTSNERSEGATESIHLMSAPFGTNATAFARPAIFS